MFDNFLCLSAHSQYIKKKKKSWLKRYSAIAKKGGEVRMETSQAAIRILTVEHGTSTASTRETEAEA